MATPSATINAVIKAGADVSVSGNDYPFMILGGFVTAAVQSGSQVTVRDASSVSATVLNSLAMEGPKNVKFEF